MYIKQIVLCGFKSYRDRTVIYDLDPELNIIVGKNGSGKSNIFNAIRYVLGDVTANFRNSSIAQRGSEGYVELLFDNSDKRFLTIEGDVKIRRSVDNPKEYWLNDKQTPHKEVLDYLESAGFGRANPFYIVPQGKVAALVSATAKERLDLLFTASGLDLFERKKADAEKSLKRSEKNLRESEANLESMSGELRALAKDAQISADYEDAEQQCKLIYRQQLKNERTKVEQVLAECESSLSEYRQNQLDTQAELEEQQQAQLDTETELSKMNYRVDNLDAQLAFVEEDQDVEMEPYENSLAALETELNELKSQREEQKAKETELELEQKQVDVRLRDLQRKQANCSRFSSKAERDEWIRSELERDSSVEADYEHRIKELESVLSTELESPDTSEITRAQNKLEKAKQNAASEQSKLGDVQNELRQLQLERRKTQLRRDLLGEQLGQNDSDSLSSLETIQETVQDLGLSNKYYGPLASLINVNDLFLKAFEAVARSAMYYCVVEDAQTVQKISTELLKKDVGRVSFIPLQQISPKKSVELDESDKELATSLLSQVECSDKYRPAVELIIGNVLVCADLDSAWQFSRKYNVDAITMQGDSVSPHGALKGGFSHQGKSRLAEFNKLSELYKELNQSKSSLSDLEQKIVAAQQQLTKQHNLVLVEQQNATKIYGTLQEVRRKHASQDERYKAQQRERDAKQKELVLLQGDLESLRSSIEQLSGELELSFDEPLTAEELESLKELSDTKNELEQSRTEVNRKLREINSRIEHHKRRLWTAELQDSFEESQPERSGPSRTELETEKSSTLASVETLKDRLQQLALTVNNLKCREVSLKKKIRKTELRQERFLGLLSKNSSELNGLGRIDSDEYEETPNVELESLYNEYQLRMKNCGSVKPYAKEQYDKFNSDYEELQYNHEQILHELEDSQVMIEQLDAYKSKAVLKTWAQVKKVFKATFEHLSRGDSAELLVDGADPMKWEGLDITVSFAKHRQLRIEQLSGGQKALCALALLLSLQSSDPTPFYIFDEVDANLDAQYRSTLSATLSELSSKLGAQFICTTFHPELVRIANKVYGTAFNKGTSDASEISKELALTLVDNQPVA